PRPCSRSQACTPDAASRPKADPPDKTMASMLSTVSAGSSRAVSRVPGPPPRTSTLAITASSKTTAVTPEPSLGSPACPTRTPGISVIRLRAIVTPGRNPITFDHVAAKLPQHACKQPRCVASRDVMKADVTYLAALLAGLVSFLSPCVLPLVPPYLVFLTGTSLERFADKEAKPRVRRETVAAAILFVLGFSTVFVALGASASVIGSLVRAYSGPLATVAGIVIIVMGLHFLGVT